MNRVGYALRIGAMIIVMAGVAVTLAATQDGFEEVKCADAGTRRVREIMHKGLDEALQNRTVDLFGVWMRDSSGQPDRAREGLEKGIDAYQHAYAQIETWHLMPCQPYKESR